MKFYELMAEKPIGCSKGRFSFNVKIDNYENGIPFINISMSMPGKKDKISFDLVLAGHRIDLSLFFRGSKDDWVDKEKESGFDCWIGSLSELSDLLKRKGYCSVCVDYSVDRANGVREQIGKRLRVSLPCSLGEGRLCGVAQYLYDLAADLANAAESVDEQDDASSEDGKQKD